MSLEDIKEHWIKIYSEVLKSECADALTSNLLIIDYWKIDKYYDAGFASFILSEPNRAIAGLKKAYTDLDLPDGIKLQFNFGDGLPVDIADADKIPAQQLNNIIAIEGTVTDASQRFLRSIEDTFQCLKCGCSFGVPQYDDQATMPTECPEDQGGCGRSTAFRLIDSKYVDLQQFLIKDFTKQKSLGAILTEGHDHLIPIYPGETLRIVGILRDKRHKTKTIAKRYVHALEAQRRDVVGSLEMSQDELQKAKELAQDPCLWKIFLQSFAPSVYGYVDVKEALLLQQFGANWYDLQDGTIQRGSIHLLLVGDPGSAKSVLLSAARNISPIVQIASGKGASGVGLTASVEKGVFEGETWTLKAGALPLAHGGVCMVDEFDKLPDSEKENLHAPMSEGLLPINKAGINTTLNCRTAVLASCNPEWGRFDSAIEIIKQLGIKNQALVTRFDLIYAIRDAPDERRDRQIAGKMGDVIRSDIEELPISKEFIRRYIHLARSVRPAFTKVADGVIIDEFVTLRQNQEFVMSFRHKNAMRRLSEAFARSRLSNSVSKADAGNAVRVFKNCYRTLGVTDLTALYGISLEDKRTYDQITPLLPCSLNDALSLGLSEDSIQRLIDTKRLREGKDGLIYGGPP